MFSDCFQTALWCPQNTSSGPLWSWIVLCVPANCLVLGGSPLPRPYRAALHPRGDCAVVALSRGLQLPGTSLRCCWPEGQEIGPGVK